MARQRRKYISSTKGFSLKYIQRRVTMARKTGTLSGVIGLGVQQKKTKMGSARWLPSL